MEEYEAILNYLYESSRIPVWIFENEKIVFTDFSKETLRKEEELKTVFEYFLKNATEEPTIRIVAEVEMFAFFRFSDGDGRTLCFVSGPVFCFHPAQIIGKRSLISEYIYAKEQIKARLADTPIVDVRSYCRFVRAAAALLLHKLYETENLKNNCVGDLTSDSLIDSALARAIFDIREEELISLYNLDSEHRLVEAIRNGNLALVTDRVGEVKYSVDRLRAPFAQETKRQREYEVVALITIATRAAVSGGLDVDTAFSMSDLYLQRIDKHKTFRELEEIARHAIRSFCEKVAECKDKELGKYSPRIQKAIKYIRTHLHYPISLAEVASYTEISPKYLSSNFFKETGKKFSDFIRIERIREACLLLRTTKMSSIEIANSLSFSSQSYFIKVFLDVMGITPQKYRGNSSAEFEKRTRA